MQRQYEHLVRAYSSDLYRFAYWLSRSTTVAEDLVQETFLRAWKNLSQLKDTGTARAWLFTILRHENARRFERKQFDYSDYEEQELPNDAEVTPEQWLAADRLQQLMLSLSTEYREPLVLQLLFGMTGEEIAQLLELNLNTVNTRLFRARLQLRDTLQSAEGVSNHG